MTNTIILKPVFENGEAFFESIDGSKFVGLIDNRKSEISYITVNAQLNKAIRVTFEDNRFFCRALKGTAIQDATPFIESDFPELGTKLWKSSEHKSKVEVETPKAISETIQFLNSAVEMKPERLKLSDLKWKYLVRSVLKAKNIMATGPSGCGKTFMTQTVSQAFPDREFFYVNLGSTQDPRAALIGNTHFSKGEGTFFSPSYFVKAIQTPNAIILLDEISRMHPEGANILMSVLDEGQRYLRLDEADGSPTVKVAPGVCFIATANIGAEYTATRVLDRALLDRFVTIEMDPLDLKAETDLLTMLYPSVPLKKIKAVAEIADMTRKEVKSENSKIGTMISTRITIETVGLMEDGFKLAEAAEVAIFPFFPTDGGVESERTFIKQIIQKYDVDKEEVDSAVTVDTEDIDGLSDERPF